MKITSSCKSILYAAALLASAAAVAQASTTVNFGVDMSTQIGLGTFVPGTDHVSARGTFNVWNELILTNDSGSATPNVYRGTAVDTTNPNPGVETYKYYNSHNGQYDDGCLNGTGKNRQYLLPATSGSTVTLPTVFFGDAGPQQTNSVTFRVNMDQMINIGAFNTNTQTVYSRGTYNGWGLSFPLANDPSILVTHGSIVTSNVYVGTYDVPGGSNSCAEFKYEIDPGGTWENDGTFYSTNKAGGGDNNRFFQLGAQTLPLVNFSDVAFNAVVTNDITFQVDMSAQIAAGRFNPLGGHTVEVRGTFNSWTAAANPMTNNPAPNTNIYTAVVRIVDTKGSPEAYKFEMNNLGENYESSSPKLTTPDSGAPNYNRTFNLTTTVGSPISTVLPSVLFSDAEATDYLLADMQVTLKVNMNGAVGSEGHAFDPAADTLWVNGEFANYGGQIGSWYPWQGAIDVMDAPIQYQMHENPLGSGVYSNTITVPKGTPLSFAYIYGLNIAVSNNLFAAPYPDEPHSGDRHRVVRSTATGAYTLTPDVWGYTYSEPLFSPYAKDAGYLTIGTVSGATRP